ncbi:Ankyrin-3 [Paramyrothecium foliicola]|nr:Ankyrin-3 [Paramyrothecium foliicola]
MYAGSRRIRIVPDVFLSTIWNIQDSPSFRQLMQTTMELLELPLEIFKNVISLAVQEMGLRQSMETRLTCRLFASEILHAIITTRIFEEVVGVQASRIQYHHNIIARYIEHRVCVDPPVTHPWVITIRETCRMLANHTKLGDNKQDQNIQLLRSSVSLCLAVKTSRLDLKVLIKDTRDDETTCKSSNQENCLAIAAWIGDLRLVKSLYHGSDTPSFFGRPSWAAAAQGNIHILRFLLAQGALPYEPNFRVGPSFKLSECPIGVAAYMGHRNIVQLYLEHEYFSTEARWEEKTAICYAVQGDQQETLKLLLEHFKQHFPIDEYLYELDSCLVTGSRRGAGNSVRILLSCGANPDESDDSAYSCLQFAAKEGSVEIVKMLLDAGASTIAPRFIQCRTSTTMVFAFLINAASVALLAVQVGDMIGGQEPSKQSTIVQLVLGSGGDNMGGNVPHIALWNEEGKRLGKHDPKRTKKEEGGDYTVAIPHDLGPEEDPAGYIMLSNFENDAVCISAIYITDDHLSTVWFGDYGKKCGMSWGISKEEIGSDRITPDCVWLDGDNTDGLNARAMSFHIKDMVGSFDRAEQYENIPETMCGSTPRFSFWGSLFPDSWIPFFDPPLAYEEDSQSGGLGKDVEPFRVLDRGSEYDKSQYMFRGQNLGRPTKEDYDWRGGYCSEQDLWGQSFCPARPKDERDAGAAKKSPYKTLTKNPNKTSTKNIVKRRPHRRGISDRLIVTSKKGHSARKLCESETSYGPDTASIVEGLFCDMETKTLYPFCGEKTKETCFDVDSKSLLLANGSKIRQRGATIPKGYNQIDTWV